jgi:hypothetical protein
MLPIIKYLLYKFNFYDIIRQIQPKLVRLRINLQLNMA